VLNLCDPRRKYALSNLRRAFERGANQRRDALHKVARIIVNAASVIGVEKLNVKNMTRSAKGTRARPGSNVRVKAALNRAILDAGFGLLRQMIISKAEEAGRIVIDVDPRYSSQECSRCGHIAARNRRRRRFMCVVCGFKCHADVNAALVIRGRAQSALRVDYRRGTPGPRHRMRREGSHDEFVL
jgi:putative transposase